jgi:hypothetical protein
VTSNDNFSLNLKPHAILERMYNPLWK